MPDGFGYNASIGFAEETVWGTAVARTKFMEIISEGIKASVERQESPSTRSLSERRRNDFLISVAGPIEMEGIYQGLEKLWKHLFGAVATTGPTDTVVYSHQFTFADALPAGLSIEAFRGDDANLEAASADSAHLYAGCKIASATLSFKPNEPFKVTFNIVGKLETIVAKTAVTFPDLSGALLIKGHQLVCERDDAAQTIDEAEITIDNGLNTGKRVMGSQYIAQPVRNTRRKVTGKLMADWTDKVIYNAFMSSAGAATGTNFKLELLLTGAVIPGSASTPYAYNLTLPACKLDGETPNVSSPGILKQAMPFFALATGTGTSDAAYLDIKNALVSV